MGLVLWSVQLPFSRRWKSPIPWKTLLYNAPVQDIIGWGYGCKPATASLLHMKVTNIVLGSTTTVPPPVNLLTTGIWSHNTDSILRSSAGFLKKKIHIKLMSYSCPIQTYETTSQVKEQIHSYIIKLEKWQL